MPSENNPQLIQGTIGWMQGFEKARFYPDDLPADWHLTYLSNELDCVAVPLEALLAEDEEEIACWEEDTHEGFRFLLYVDSDGQTPPVAQLLERLKPLQQKFQRILSTDPEAVGTSVEQLSSRPLEAEWEGEIDRLLLGERTAVVTAKGELSPMRIRQLLERLRQDDIDTLLWSPGVGLVSNLANTETISSLMG